MNLFNFSTIRSRLTFWFLALTLIPLLFVLILIYFQQSSALKESNSAKLIAIRDLKVERLNDWLGERKEDIITFSEDRELTDLENVTFETSNSKPDSEILENSSRILKRIIKNYPVYNELFILNPHTGEIMVSTNAYTVGEDKSTSEYYTKTLESKSFTITDIYYSNTLSKNTMVFSMPLFCSIHKGEHIVAILVARIDINRSLYPMLLHRVGLGNTGETLIVNEDVVALNELRWHENAPLNLHIKAQPAINAANGEKGIAIMHDYRDEHVLAAYSYVPMTKWGFVCKQDVHELNAPIRDLIFKFIIIFILAAFIIVFLTIGISRSISNPIVHMNDVAKKIGGGDFSYRNEVNSRDELGTLASEFNNMADITLSRMVVQKNISEISETIIGKSSQKEFGHSLLKRLMKITKADMSTFYVLNEGTMEYEPFTSIAANEEMLRPFSAENPAGEFGNALSTKKIFHLKNMPEDTVFKYNTVAGQAIPKEIITIPIVVENDIVALVSLVNIQRFSEESLEILKRSWTSINTSYSSLIASERTRVLAEHLSRINQQLEAQSEELQDQAEELKDQTEELQHTSEELQEQNVELEAQRKQVDLANNLKSEFLSNMSHELRTPLNSIMALSRVLMVDAKDKLNEDENSYLEIVERNGKRLLILINDILDLSKIEAGKMDIYPELFSLPAFFQIIKENMQSLCEEKGLNLIVDLPETLPNIESDESRLHQVFTNIVGNAVKFTNEGSVHISVQHNSKFVTVKVEDTGIGISDDQLPSIFDEFRQVDGSSSREYEGTGLGLAIAKKMITVLGGEIKAESKLGKGSVFTLRIPIKWHMDDNLSDSNGVEENISKPKQTQTNAESHRETEDTSTIRILMVEDNQDAIVQVKSVLKKENYVVDIASGGQEALDYVQHTIPDGIILDLMMPGIDGFEVLEKLRGTEKTKNIPVLILTAKDLTRADLSRLSANNVQQLIHKGDVDIKGMLLKVKLMLGVEPESKPTLSHTGQADLKTVLVVEDNKDNMTTIKAILKAKYNIVEAFDGEQGSIFAQSVQPDIILLDMSLPKLDGQDLLEILKTKEPTKNIPVIAVTAQAMIGDKEKFLTSGCDGYVSKPIDHVKLFSELSKLLNT